MSRRAWHHLNMAGIVSSKNRVNLKTELYSFVSALSASNIVKQALFFAGETTADYSDLHVYLDSPSCFCTARNG